MPDRHPWELSNLIVDQTLSYLKHNLIRCWVTAAAIAALLLVVGMPISMLHAQEDGASAEAMGEKEMASDAPTSFRTVRLQEAPKVSQRAWESRPYQVAVWICHRGEPQLVAVETSLVREIETFCELLDPSAWFVNAGTPPPKWRNMLYSNFEKSEGFTLSLIHI